MSANYYQILSVEPTASQKEIQDAADKLITAWGEKRGLSTEKRLDMLGQIRKAAEVLVDPIQRFDYDVKQGFKRDFGGQTSRKRSFIPLKFSESVETLETVKIPGQLDYEKLERAIAAMEDLTGVRDSPPEAKPASESETKINVLKDFHPRSASINIPTLPPHVKKSLDTPSDSGIDYELDENRDLFPHEELEEIFNEAEKSSEEETETETETFPRPAKSVSATAQIAGTDVRTVYSFGSDADMIEVFVRGELRVKIVDDEKHVTYCNEMQRDDLPPVGDVLASTVIAANSCVITTEVTRKGARQSIVVYKDDTLLCKNGSTIIRE